MRRWPAAAAALGVLAGAAGCAAPGPVGPLRFLNQPPVWRVDDRRDVTPRPPATVPGPARYLLEASALRPLTRLLELPAPRRAADVNAIEEVPDSTWFENRIGARPLGPAELGRGPGGGRSPDRARPWQLTGARVSARAVALRIVDARGERWLLELDRAGHPELASGAAVVVQRLLWAAGYHVVEQHVAYFRRADLHLIRHAAIEDALGERLPMTVAELDSLLARTDRGPGGRYRALASRVLPGVALGGFAAEGRRAGDPNDVIDHQHRRSLRGLYVLAAWLDHTALGPAATLDLWVDDPSAPGHHFVIHYLTDFGQALGVLGALERARDDGHAHAIDPGVMLRSALSLGLWRRPWDGVGFPALRGVGWIDARSFHPGRWRPQVPYAPFERRDDADGFWAAALLARLTPAHLKAAVDQGRHSDPRAAAYLTWVLAERRRATLAYWFARVNPLADFAVTSGDAPRLCFVDLAIRHGVAARRDRTRYRARFYDERGRRAAGQATGAAGPGGATCVALQPQPGPARYTIAELHTWRGPRALPPVHVHLAADPASGALRVIGLRRR